MGNPYAPRIRKVSEGGQWPSDLLFERLTLLGFGIKDFEGLIDAYGDPDFEADARGRYSVGDVELRALVAGSKGETADEWAPAVLPSDPAAVVGADGFGADFDPSATIQSLLAFVGGDRVRALRVLETERAKGGDARSTLIAALRKVVEHG